MPAEPAIDARMHAALARLTANEKECLRRRLQQQTAKEMALELGVSPHAVEKRLKMARTKLGLSSSLEAARLLIAAEEYQRAGPQAAGLPAQALSAHSPSRGHLVGSYAMIALLAAAVLLVVQASGGGTTGPSSFRLPDARTIDGLNWDRIPPEDMAAFLTEAFAALDRDGSGYIEQAEVPGDAPHADTSFDKAGKTGPEVDGRVTARRRWIAANDHNDDRRVSPDEFRRASSEGERWRLIQPGRVAATREEIAAIGQANFHRLDADGSGSLEGNESPYTALPQGRLVYRRDEGGEPGRPTEWSEEQARADFYRLADKDGDRRVSVPEFYRWMAMHLAGGMPTAARASLRRLVPPEG